jgi:hypothetical protein
MSPPAAASTGPDPRPGLPRAVALHGRASMLVRGDVRARSWILQRALARLWRHQVVLIEVHLGVIGVVGVLDGKRRYILGSDASSSILEPPRRLRL